MLISEGADVNHVDEVHETTCTCSCVLAKQMIHFNMYMYTTCMLVCSCWHACTVYDSLILMYNMLLINI